MPAAALAARSNVQPYAILPAWNPSVVGKIFSRTFHAFVQNRPPRSQLQRWIADQFTEQEDVSFSRNLLRDDTRRSAYLALAPQPRLRFVLVGIGCRRRHRQPAMPSYDAGEVHS